MFELNPKKESPVAGMEGLGGGATGALFTYIEADEPPGQVLFDTPGTTTWTVPNGVTSVSVVCIGAGNNGGQNGGRDAGGGGALVYGNNIATTPGATINLQVGEMAHMYEDTWFSSSGVLLAEGGEGGGTAATTSGSAKTAGNDGGIRGTGVSSWGHKYGGGGAGAGGYTGAGGAGGNASSGPGAAGYNDAAGGGGSSSATGGSQCYSGGGGGGSDVFGTQGNASNGNARTTGGSGGTNGAQGGRGGSGQGNLGYNDVSTSAYMPGPGYGGGVGSKSSSTGCATFVARHGAIRIIWPGDTRSFPSNCADV